MGGGVKNCEGAVRTCKNRDRNSNQKGERNWGKEEETPPLRGAARGGDRPSKTSSACSKLLLVGDKGAQSSSEGKREVRMSSSTRRGKKAVPWAGIQEKGDSCRFVEAPCREKPSSENGLRRRGKGLRLRLQRAAGESGANASEGTHPKNLNLLSLSDIALPMNSGGRGPSIIRFS